MSDHSVTSGTAQDFVELRRARVLSTLGGDPAAVGSGAEPLDPDRLDYLTREAQDLYWNELAWEELTDEESVAGGHLTELVFPGFLAFVDGLLLERVPRDSPSPPRPHPDAVEVILAFLGERQAELAARLEAGVDSQSVVWARAMTSHLIDLVLYRLYGVNPSRREALDTE